LQAAKKKERKKPADGYDQASGFLFKVCPVAKFMEESYDGAVAILATHNLITFPPGDAVSTQYDRSLVLFLSFSLALILPLTLGFSPCPKRLTR